MLKKDLIELAVKRGMGKTEATKKKKDELIAFLKLSPSKLKKVSSPSSYKGRTCGPAKSKKNPDAYSKDELVDLAMKDLHMSKTEAKKLTKEELCKALNSGDVKEERKSPAKRKKSPSKKVSPSKRKKSPSKKKVSQKKSPSKRASPSRSKSPVERKSPSKQKKVVITPIKPFEVKEVKTPLTAEEKKIDCVKRSKVPLKDHQIRVVNFLRNHRGVIACHSTGSGKTLLAVAASQCFLDDHPGSRVIVVTPTSLQDNFKKELKAYGGKEKHYDFYTLEGFARHYKHKKCPEDAMLIIDEAHNLRTAINVKKAEEADKPSRSYVALKCAKKVKKVLLLTATPVYNDPYDMANLVSMVKGKGVVTRTEFKKILKNETDFRYFFSNTMSFFTAQKDENYPEAKESFVEILMDDDYLRRYQRLEENIANDQYGISKDSWLFLTGLRQGSNALEGCPKCKWVMDKVKEGKKTLIYSAFLTKGLGLLKKMMDDEKIPYREVTGKLSKKERSEAVKDFNTDKVSVLFISKAGGEGLDLKGTRNVIVFESSWNRPNEEQVIGRAIRYRSHSHLPKNEQKVDVYYLLLVKPEGYRYKSGDSMLREMTVKKEQENEMFLRRLVNYSIEQN